MSELIKLNDLVESPLNPRTHFDERALAELADSIRSMGLLQPLVVRKKRGRSTKYEIVCGHRRYRAFVLLGRSEVLCEVVTMNDVDATIAALIENAQRADVSPLDESRAVGRLTDAGLEDVPELAVKLGRTPRWVKDRLRLRALIPELQKLLEQQTIPLGGALVLSVLTPERQAELAPVLSKKRESWDGPWTVESVRREALRLARELADVPWNRNEDGIGGQPPCKACPKQTGAQGDLFGVAQAAQCMDAACYELKFKVWVATQRANGVDVREGTYWDEPEAHRPVSHQLRIGDMKVTWGELAPQAPRVTWLGVQGMPQTVRHADVLAELDAAGRTEQAAWVRANYPDRVASSSSTPARKPFELKREIAGELELVLVTPALAAPAGLRDDVSAALLECAVRGARCDELDFVAKRRGVHEKGRRPEETLRAYLRTAAPADRWNALVELLAVRAGVGFYGGTERPGLKALQALVAGGEATP